MDAKARDRCLKEVKLLQTLPPHPCIIRYIDALIDSPKLSLTLALTLTLTPSLTLALTVTLTLTLTRYIDAFIDSNELYIVFEWAAHGQRQG